MPPIHTRRALFLSLALALAACGSGDAQLGAAGAAPDSEGAGAARAGGDATPRASAGEDRFEATVASAPFAGTHALAGPMTCMMYNGTWQAVHETDRADGLSAMLLQVRAVPAAGGSSDRLNLTLTFGQMGDESGTAGMLDLHGTETGGDARASIERDGAGAVIRTEGTAQSGARVTTELRCATVEFMR